MNGTRKRSQEEATRTEKRARTEAGEGATPSPLPSSSHDEAMKSSEASKASLDIDARVGAGAPPHVQGAVSALSNIEEKSDDTEGARVSGTSARASASTSVVRATSAGGTTGKASVVKTVVMRDGKTRLVIQRILKAVEARDLTLTDAEMEYFDIILDRVIPILNFKDVKTNRFAVGTIPFVIDWGTEKQGTDMDRYIIHGNSCVTAWFLGFVTSVWLCPREGSRINIGLKLLTQRDHDTARHLQYDLSKPAMDPSDAGETVFCSRFLPTRAEEGGTFEEVYDAQDRLLPWGQMPQIDPARVQKTDLVLVECYIKRFKGKERSARRGWNTWGVNFDLIRIAYLCAGPGAAGDIVPDDCEVNL